MTTHLPENLYHYHKSKGNPWCLETCRNENDGQAFRAYLAAYHALVAEMDHHIGSILQCIDELQLANDTIIIYTTDHGDFVGEHGLAEKAAWAHNVYEATLRVPLIIRCPGIKNAGRVSEGLAELVDLYPSLLDLCQIPVEPCSQHIGGLSLKQHLLEETPIQRDYSVSENRLQRTVISDRYKLSVPAQIDDDAQQEMLFDRVSDPHELDNRINDPELQPLINELKNALQEWDEKVPALAS